MQNQLNGQSMNGISSPAVNPQTNLSANYVDIIKQLEMAIKSDVQRVVFLTQQGTINKTQGQALLTQLAKKMDEINKCKNTIGQINQPVQSVNPAVQSPMDLFNAEKPGFFDGPGRADVLNYIKDLDMDKDEISKIAQLVENLENLAVDGYLKKSAHEKSLNDENYAAKSKLTSYAQNTSGNSGIDRIFTREDIGRMSGEEFAKNEKLIMDQVKQGLIK